MGELDLIRWIRRHSTCTGGVIRGIGDDTAVVDVTLDKSIVITTDTLLDGTHFELAKCKPAHVGRKAAACSISDVAAMGCTPLYALVSLNIPDGIDEGCCRAIYRGIFAITEEYNIQVIGGDIVSGDCALSINVTVIGTVLDGQAVCRSGAKPDDVIMVTGKLGGSAYGKHLMFKPRVAEGIRLNRDFGVNSMVDISDGLLIDLHHILEESNMGAVIDVQQIPIADDAHKLAEDTKTSAVSHALSDGEDYELLFTASEAAAAEILRVGVSDVHVSRIGHVRAKDGLFLRGIDGKENSVSPDGFEHSITKKING